jgi:hypothetical protein
VLNGASTTLEVDAAIDWSTNFFENHDPDDKLSKPDRREVISFANPLDQYNNGYISPGHCSE